MLCVPVFIYLHPAPQLSSFRAPALWFIDLTVTANTNIQYTFLSLCHLIVYEKTDKTQKYSISPPFSYDMKIAVDSY